MGNRRGGASLVAAVGYLAMLSLSACDPGHPFEDVQVKIFSTGDGRATMSAEVLARTTDDEVVDEALFLQALAQILAIGDVVGPAAQPPDPGSPAPAVELAQVPTDQLTVQLSSVLLVMDQFGLSDTSTVFVSVCTSARTGTAAGKGVEVQHLSSCATWEPTPRPATTDAVATLTFGERPAPSGQSATFAFVFAAVALAGAAVFIVSTGRSRTAGIVVAVIGGAASFVILASATIRAIRQGDPWMATGQTFDADVVDGWRAVMAIAGIGGLLVPAALLAVGAVMHRRSTAGP